MLGFDGFDYLNSLLPLKTFHKNPEERLARLALILEKIGNPQKNVATIHLAGSKGKGSTAGYIASMLSESGFKVALFTSPHVNHVKERLVINGEFIDDDDWHQALYQLKDATESLPIEPTRPEPTYFEALTLSAFYLADYLKVDYLVLETGIGGRLDPTNLCTPCASVITSIELEHVEILGKTLEAIALEKAGIIKAGVPVFCSRQKETVLETIKEQAIKASASFFYISDAVSNLSCYYSKKNYSMYGTFVYKNKRVDTLFRMLGNKQLENAALALLTVDYSINCSLLELLEAYRRAVEQLVLPMRTQILRHDPLVMIDAAHTYESLKSLVEVFSFFCTEEKVLIFSCADDKDLKVMLTLFSGFSLIIMCSLGEKNRLTAVKNYELVKGSYTNTSFIAHPSEALELALQYKRPVLITGSFYFSNYLAVELAGRGPHH